MRTRKSDNGKVKINGTPESISVKEAGYRGGTATRDRHAGTDFYQRIGAKGGRATAELYASLLREFGKRGGRPKRPALSEPVGERNQQ